MFITQPGLERLTLRGVAHIGAGDHVGNHEAAVRRRRGEQCGQHLDGVRKDEAVEGQEGGVAHGHLILVGSERQQLREDEESLEKQMRGMEVAMARERALMARQETELKRLSAEIQHELEIMQRGDANLRDQMQKFQRRAQDVLQGCVTIRPTKQCLLQHLDVRVRRLLLD